MSYCSYAFVVGLHYFTHLTTRYQLQHPVQLVQKFIVGYRVTELKPGQGIRVSSNCLVSMLSCNMAPTLQAFCTGIGMHIHVYNGYTCEYLELSS